MQISMNAKRIPVVVPKDVAIQLEVTSAIVKLASI